MPGLTVMSGKPCQCELIASVREDERRKYDVPWYSHEYHLGYQRGLVDGKKP